LLYKNVHAYFGPTLSVSRVQRWIDDVTLVQLSFPTAVSLYPGHGGSAFNTVGETLGFQLYLRRFLSLVNSCVPPTSLASQMIHFFPRYNSTSSFLSFIGFNPAWATFQSVACDRTNSTRAQLCAVLTSRNQCEQARPLCIFRRATTTSGRKRLRPSTGTCLPSLRPLKPSPPLGNNS